jgi:hypothetical protein
MSKPEPRPALTKAPDAGLHPVSGRPAPVERRASKEGTSKGSAADAITGTLKDKYVDLGVRVPKSVRKRLRQEAKARGITTDELATALLATALPR